MGGESGSGPGDVAGAASEVGAESESGSEPGVAADVAAAAAAAALSGGGSLVHWVRRAGAVLLGLALALGAAEYTFAALDEGAYPHLNCYMPSETLGVALEPGVRTRLAFRGNPAADVRINAGGFRGPALSEGRDDEIVVIGDSQTFGLGVEDDETFSAVLAELSGRPVINAGVPTYGPLEYVAVAREVFETRSPTTIVVVMNMASDFFEHSRPNTERHAVWDGWAVRAETAPHDVARFPGREWLFRYSHAFFALRALLHTTEHTVEAIRDTGFASEGTLRDLVHGGEEASEIHEAAARAHAEEIASHRARIAGLEAEIEAAETDIDGELADELRAASEQASLGTGNPDDRIHLQARAARGHPGDIVGSWDEGASSRDVLVTATLLNRGVRLRRHLEARARARQGGQAINVLIDHRAELQGALAEERAHGVAGAVAHTVLEPRIRELMAIAHERGAELLVVGLPLDVLVDETEFEKYGHDVVDIGDASLLLTDLVDVSHRLGARALDATEALRSAEPRAFLREDLHMSPRGHRVLAEAIHDTLMGPNAFRQPDPGLPAGRSAVPEPDEFLHAVEVNAAGSTAAGCAADLVREWLRVSCRKSELAPPTRVELIEGGHSEALTVTTPAAATLLAPVFAGDDLVADFHWTDRSQRLTLHWPANAEAPELSFGERRDPVYPEAVEDPGAARLCECHIEVHGWTDCRSDADYECGASCEELYGAASAECLATYTDECEALLRCARGDPEVPPPCSDGRVNALGTQRCLSLCREGETCAAGSCVDWQHGHVCVSGGAFGSEESGPPIVLDERALPRTASATVASFGGERCRVQSLGPTPPGRRRRAVVTPGGALVASHQGGVTMVQAFDERGVPRAEPVVVFEVPRLRGIRSLALELVRVGERNLLGYAYPCADGACFEAVALDDEGAVVGRRIRHVEFGEGQGDLAMMGGDEEAWVAFGTERVAMRLERWTISGRGTIERTPVAELEVGLPASLAVDGEHWALLFRTPGSQVRLQVDGAGVVRVAVESRLRDAVLLLDGARSEVRWRIRQRSMRAVLEAGADEPTISEMPSSLPERLSLDEPVRLIASPRGSLLRRLDAATHLPVAHPIRLPGGTEAAVVWAGNGALVFDAAVRRVHCR